MTNPGCISNFFIWQCRLEPGPIFQTYVMSWGLLSVFNVEILKPSLKRDNGPLHFTSIFEICSEEYLFAALVRDVKLGYFEILYDKIFIYYKDQTNTIFLYFLQRCSSEVERKSRVIRLGLYFQPLGDGYRPYATKEVA